MKFGSLFSGIGGFDLGFERAGMECAWQCEIDAKARDVLRKHWPDVPIVEDVRDVGRDTVEPVDLICGGFPCQDLSVAGKRAGLAGERSGLWFEFHRVLEEMLPRFVVIENVPGLLSSNDGKDIQIVIDMLTQIGYTVDIDIKDAQEFGVAQRRRRVFLTCVRLDDLLKRKTNLSRQISADLLAQILLNAWGATRQASSLVPLHSVYENPIERSVNLLRKMTSLLEITRERLACKKYQNNLDALLDQFGAGGKNSEFGLIRKSEIQKGESSGKTVMFPSELKAENGDTSISLWLSEYLDAVCETGNRSTISTSTNQITDHQIYIFAVMALLIAERILLSIDWSESCWSVASSLSILLQENTNYARQASRNLFIEPGLRDGWRDYLSAASCIQGEIERHLGAIRERQILFEREGVRWNPPARRKAGEGIANAITARFGKNGGAANDDVDQGRLISGTLDRKSTSSNRGSQANECEFIIVSPTLRSEAKGSNMTGDGHLNSNLIAFNADRDGQDASEEISPTILHKGDGDKAHQAYQKMAVAFGGNNTAGEIDIATAQNAHGGTGRHDFESETFVCQGVGVRRFTPTECARLQGFPDDWNDWLADSARYRQFGNAVAVPCAEWLGRRIVEAERGR